MKKLCAIFVLLISNSVFAANEITFKDADLKCYDGSVEIGIYHPGMPAVLSGEEFKISDLAKQNITIKIRRGQQVQEFVNQTIAVEDGAGNVRYHTLTTNTQPDGQSMDLLEIMNLDYDHEEGFLTGFYAVRVPKSDPSTFTYKLVNMESYTMNCFDYTYGDKSDN